MHACIDNEYCINEVRYMHKVHAWNEVNEIPVITSRQVKMKSIFLIYKEQLIIFFKVNQMWWSVKMKSTRKSHLKNLPRLSLSFKRRMVS